MDEFKIILFVCNWGPHVAFQTLQDQCAKIPVEVKMIRIPCTGRINKALLLKAFEMGADGVALVGCTQGTCRYGSGTTTAIENTRDARNILELIGLGENRLRLATFLPDESESMLMFLNDFYNEIKLLGHSPVTQTRSMEPIITNDKAIAEIISSHDIFACQDCGKCTAACPLALAGKPFSPRAIAGSILAGKINSPMVQKDIWTCLTCARCYDLCPSAVNFPEFIRDVRHIFVQNSVDSHETHGGFFHSMMRTMTSPELKPKRWSNLPEKIGIDSNSKVLFFGGCAPYYDIFFRKFLGVNTNSILTDSLRLLNFFDIQPALLEDERCCGHDLLWSGDRENFIKLAKLNVESIHRMEIEEVITACPECYRTMAHDYAEYGIKLNFKITHIYEFLEREIEKGAVDFKRFNKRITFQDSCRLSRFEQKSDLPRKLIAHLKPLGFKEMQDSKNAAICCGNCAWTGCDSFSKALQVKRLRQAHDTESDILITSCPKCQIHFKCAMEDPFLGEELEMKMMDLTSVIAKTIYWK